MPDNVRALAHNPVAQQKDPEFCFNGLLSFLFFFCFVFLLLLFVHVLSQSASIRSVLYEFSALWFVSQLFYSLHKKGGSSYEDTIIHKSGLVRCMLFTSITRMYKLYLFPIKISGAITDFSVYVYRLLHRENIYWYSTDSRWDVTVQQLCLFLRMSVSVRSLLNVLRTSSILDCRNLLFFLPSTLFFSICECQASY